jgi:hypothetical protein
VGEENQILKTFLENDEFEQAYQTVQDRYWNLPLSVKARNMDPEKFEPTMLEVVEDYSKILRAIDKKAGQIGDCFGINLHWYLENSGQVPGEKKVIEEMMLVLVGISSQLGEIRNQNSKKPEDEFEHYSFDDLRYDTKLYLSETAYLMGVLRDIDSEMKGELELFERGVKDLEEQLPNPQYHGSGK